VRPVSRRLTDRGEERRRQLLTYATARFAEHGYHPTSVADIVNGLGVGKGVFYWYFDNKEELFRSILREAQLDLRRRQRDALAGAPDPLSRIAAGIRASVRWSAEHHELFTLVAFAATDDRFSGLVRRGQEVAVADAMRHVDDAIEQGLIPDRNPLELTRAMFGVTSELTRHFLHQEPEAAVSVDEIAETAAQFCLGGLLGPDARDAGVHPVASSSRPLG